MQMPRPPDWLWERGSGFEASVDCTKETLPNTGGGVFSPLGYLASWAGFCKEHGHLLSEGEEMFIS